MGIIPLGIPEGFVTATIISAFVRPISFAGIFPAAEGRRDREGEGGREKGNRENVVMKGDYRRNSACKPDEKPARFGRTVFDPRSPPPPIAPERGWFNAGRIPRTTDSRRQKIS